MGGGGSGGADRHRRPLLMGYFLYQTKGNREPGEVEIIARLTSEAAALRLKEMLSLK
jgi:hypothetical protein